MVGEEKYLLGFKNSFWRNVEGQFKQILCRGKKWEEGYADSERSYSGIRVAIHRALTASPFGNCNVNDRVFMSSNQMFTARYKQAIKKCKTTKQQSSKRKCCFRKSILLIQLLNLLNYNNVWFSLCFQFGRRGCKGWRKLWSTIFL